MTVGLFDVRLVHEPSARIGIAEGEIDAMSATLAGIPTIGVPGIESWRSRWSYLLEMHSDVIVWADGDGPGRKGAASIARTVPNARVVEMPEGEDVNSVFVSGGAGAILERLGSEDEW